MAVIGAGGLTTGGHEGTSGGVTELFCISIVDVGGT